LDSDREEIRRLFDRKIARWSHKRREGRGRRKPVNKKVQGDTGFIRMGRHFIIYKTAQMRCWAILKG
jgi:hypothetical protein